MSPSVAFQIPSTTTKQLPLHLAIENYSATIVSEREVLINIWKQYPEAATIVDGKYHLFAFQLVAAAAACRTIRPNDENDDIDSLEISFLFLKAFPQVLHQQTV